MGGKGRIAKAIVKAIVDRHPDAPRAYEPFMGGGAVTARLAQHYPVTASDAHPDLIALWRAVLKGWHPPEVVTEAEYAELREQTEPSAMRGFVGFGGSFGGKWFSGYARGGYNGTTPRNHQGESARAIERIGTALRAGVVTVELRDYATTPVLPDSVVYLDPPYRGTQGYATGGFDHVDFWAWAELVASHSHVYVSEYWAPPWWSCVWSAQKRQSVTLPSQGRGLRTERLFTL